MTDVDFHLDLDLGHVWWGHDCPGMVCVPGAGPVRSWSSLPLGTEGGWTMTQNRPLTVIPSLMCTGCGTHGFITDGEWVGV